MRWSRRYCSFYRCLRAMKRLSTPNTRSARRATIPGRIRMFAKRGPIRFATYLAPNMYPVYQCVADYVGRQLECPTELAVGESFTAFASGDVDVGFICGLPYVQLTRHNP